MKKKTQKILAERFGILFTTKYRREEMAVTPAERSYTVLNLILMFFIFSAAGWVWEVALGFIKEGVIVNRGALYGPWLPIYGRGAVLILILLKGLRDRPAAEFASIVVLCGSMEYFLSWYLETMYGGKRWWDYTGCFLNLNGRICAAGLFLFGAAGMFVVYVAAPRLDDLLKKFRPKILIGLAALLVTIYAGDQIRSAFDPNSGQGITCSFEDDELNIFTYRKINENI